MARYEHGLAAASPAGSGQLSKVPEDTRSEHLQDFCRTDWVESRAVPAVKEAVVLSLASLFNSRSTCVFERPSWSTVCSQVSEVTDL